VVVSLIELSSYLPDVCGDTHEISMGEANENIPITVPEQSERAREGARFGTRATASI